MKNPIFSEVVTCIYTKPLKCTYYGNPMVEYTFEREDGSAFQAKNLANSYGMVNCERNDTIKLNYRRKGKSWDFVALNYEMIKSAYEKRQENYTK